MKLDEYAAYDATGLADLVRSREVTPGELVQLAREAHDRVNPTINAVVEFYEDAETVPGSDTGLFSGVPFLHKDSGPAEAGRLQEVGSRLLRGSRPTVDSYFIERARAGACGSWAALRCQSSGTRVSLSLRCTGSLATPGTWNGRQVALPGARLLLLLPGSCRSPAAVTPAGRSGGQRHTAASSA